MILFQTLISYNIFVNSYNLNITSMHKYFAVNTPQKAMKSQLKELSPVPSLLSHRGIKLQILMSPVTPRKDLFMQLLGTEIKQLHDNYDQYEIMEEESEQMFERIDFQQSLSEQDSFSFEENDEDEDQNDVRKRKRKSTAQIKILKAELDVESNWSKQKIVQMSDLTGLSQSQVYKWWWDQKKKTVKNDRDAYSRLAHKRKLIRKDFKRGLPYEKNALEYEIDDAPLTKLKSTIDIEEAPETQRKVNKRLVFS